jgi:intracellular septation protein A
MTIKLHGWYRLIGIMALLDNFGTLSIIYRVNKFVDLEKTIVNYINAIQLY